MLILYQLYLNDRLIVHLFVHCVFYASVSAKVQACLEVSEGLWVGNWPGKHDRLQFFH